MDKSRVTPNLRLAVRLASALAVRAPRGDRPCAQPTTSSRRECEGRPQGTSPGENPPASGAGKPRGGEQEGRGLCRLQQAGGFPS